MDKTKVLFVCIHNSARSQMAEAFLNRLGEGRYTAESAGLEAGKMNPVVVEVMREAGYDLSGNQTRTVMDFLKAGKSYDIVVTVCDAANGERCPIFPGKGIKLHWSFDDPSSFKGTPIEKLEFTRKVRNQIKERVEQFIRDLCTGNL